MLGQSVSRSMAATSSASEPVLKSVLASLDVQIDEELARYRRHRLLQRRSQPKGKQPRVAASSPVPAAAGVALPAVSSSTPTPPYPELMPSPWDDVDTVAIARLEQTQPWLEERSSASMPPDDYLESSEHLLRSLGDEEPDPDSAESNDSLLNQLLTPAGVGGLLLLLVSSAMLGFLIVNPSMLGIDRWGSLFQRGAESSDPVPDSSVPDSSDQSSLTSPPYPNLAADEFIDLNLETLSTLPGRSPILGPLAVNPSPSSAASPAAAPESVSIATIGVNGAAPTIISTNELPSNPLPAADPAPAPSAEPAPAIPEVSPEPVAAAPAYVEPAPAPASEPAVTASAASSDPGSYYYVVTDYSGDRSLEAAQSVVGDAYVRNFDNGAQVQLGAFSSADRAQELIEELQQQGISAEVYQP